MADSDNYSADLSNYSTVGWGEYANCLVEDAEDLSFVKKPSEFEARRQAKICAACPVFWECLDWADRLDVREVFVAGEWRE